MRILCVNYEYWPQCGGAGLNTEQMIKEYVKLGHDVSLLIGWDYSFGNPKISKGVTVHIIKTKKKSIHEHSPVSLLKFVLAGILKMRKLTQDNKYDVIQFWFSVPTGILKYGIIGNIPYVVTLRGLDIPGLRGKYSMLQKVSSGLNKVVAHDAAQMLALTNESAQAYKVFSSIKDIKIIPNASDPERFTAKVNYSTVVSKFISVGRLVTFKKFDLLIYAFVKLHDKYPEITLDIYGIGPLFNELQSQINTLDAIEYIKLCGYIEQDELKNKYTDYDLFVLASTGESFGNVFIEAMMIGLATVAASAPGGALYVLEDNITGHFFKPDDATSIYETLKWFVENPDKAEEYGRNAARIARGKYTPEAVAKQYLSALENVVNEGNLFEGNKMLFS